jgi:prephenate dehydrogenase
MKTLRDCTVTLVGLGQIGASLGRALVARRACRRVLGVSRKPETIREALRLRAAHEASADFDGSCRKADLVLLATPIRTILRLIPRAASAMTPGSLLMDTGSTKRDILSAASACLPLGVRFVGGHPMAGRSGSGPSTSDPRLFAGRPFVLTPGPQSGRRPDRLAVELASAVGAKPLTLSAAVHDDAVALISHLPHAIAVALVLEAKYDPGQWPLRLAAGSFMSATRVASTDTDMLLDIFMTNRTSIVRRIRQFRESLRRMETWIRLGKEKELETAIRKAREIREGLTSL